MKDKKVEVNYDWKPKAHATGVRVFVKIDAPKDIEIGGKKVDALTGTTDWGFQLLDSTASAEAKMLMTGQFEAEVHSVGPGAFQRKGLEDMAPGGVNEVKPGDRVWIEEFTGKPLRDEKGCKTLYYHVLEHQIIGKVE